MNLSINSEKYNLNINKKGYYPMKILNILIYNLNKLIVLFMLSCFLSACYENNSATNPTIKDSTKSSESKNNESISAVSGEEEKKLEEKFSSRRSYNELESFPLSVDEVMNDFKQYLTDKGIANDQVDFYCKEQAFIKN